MKKLLFFLLFALIFLLFSCSGDGSPDESAVELVQLSRLNITLYEGQTYIAEATVLPSDAANKNLEWSVSNPGICSVDDGLITALSEGVCAVTAKAENGVAASVQVQVKKIVDIQSICFDSQLVSLEVGGTHTPEVICTPSSASDKIPIRWSSTDNEVASVDVNGVITANGEGACLIYADVATVLRAACEVRVGEHEADLSLIADVSVRDLPVKLDRKDFRGDVITSVELTSYEVIRELTESGVKITLLINGTKTFDRDGADAQNSVKVFMNLYMEDGQHCDQWVLKAGSVSEGDSVSFEFMFNAVVKQQPRIFYVILSEDRSEDVG